MADDASALRRVYNAVTTTNDSSSSVVSEPPAGVVPKGAGTNAAAAALRNPPPVRRETLHPQLTSDSSFRQSQTSGTEGGSDDDDDIETLESIARRVGKTLMDIRRLNPHVKDFDDDEPLPPGTKLVFKKRDSNSRGTPPPQAAAGAGEQQRTSSRSAPQGPTSTTVSPFVAAAGDNASGLTLRKIGAKLRRTRTEIVSELPHLNQFELDDELPYSALSNRIVGGTALTDLCHSGSMPKGGAPLSAAALSQHPRDGGHDRQAIEGHRRGLSSPDRRSTPMSPLLPLRQAASVPPLKAMPDRSQRGGGVPSPKASRMSSPGASARHAAPEYPRPLSPVSDSDSFSARHRKRAFSREKMTMRCKVPHKIFVTPIIDVSHRRDRYNDDEAEDDEADDDRYTIRTIARHVARCAIDDLLDLNPELETLFGVDDFLPEGTAVCVPPNAIVPRPRLPVAHINEDTQHSRASQSVRRAQSPSTLQRNGGNFATETIAVPSDDGFVDVRPAVSRAQSPAVRGGPQNIPRQPAARSGRRDDAPIAAATAPRQPFKPSAAIGRTLSEIAWSLGISVDDIRNENPDLNRYSSHELLPEGVQLFVPMPADDPITPSLQEQAAIAERARELRSRAAADSGAGDRPQYRRCTSRSPVRGGHGNAAARAAGPVSSRGSSTATPSQQYDDAHHPGLRTASSSVDPSAADTNLKRFVVTNPMLTVDLIAKRLSVHPDVIYDLNTPELVEGPDGVYHYRQRLPVGMLLHLPATSRR